jgi:hypothetical protein
MTVKMYNVGWVFLNGESGKMEEFKTGKLFWVSFFSVAPGSYFAGSCFQFPRHPAEEKKTVRAKGINTRNAKST